MFKAIEDKIKNCVACMASGKNLNYNIPRDNFGKLKTLTEPGQENQIDIPGKLNHKKLNREHQILIALDRFSKCSTVRIRKSSETKDALIFFKQSFLRTPGESQNGQKRSTYFQRTQRLL